MAAGSAVLEAVANDEFLERVRETGARLRARLEQFIGNYPELFELVRGKGLMLGIKMKSDSRAFYAHMRANHQLLTVAAGDKRSEEHTSELQPIRCNSSAVFCLSKKPH